MGSMIHLTLGRIQLDWGKNAGFYDHGPLFRPSDLAEIPYYYAADADDKECQHLPLISRSSGFSYRLITEMKEGFSAPLRVVAERLELLGYTEKYCRREFEELTSTIANINGKAAAIECYLDISRAPVVRWTNYDQRRDCYQGHLVEKETFSKEFLSQKVLVDGYDYSGLETVLDMLLRECISINEENSATALESGRF
ncbi:HEPN/Toprim-associated domain-containing protein [Rhizobium laguerreae]|uniref:HEPN/Toprim-associated domain-containing protein n=1 Tax=Rhizobium laguerreae TaxID=1076926 RepID=UPI001C91C04B|nr:HEPN/Toprim-associated domain-containing protein [Rhizobium laguerreae]MBY3123217.1 hypothetical protein [Rhizobium laguerreae]